MRHKYHNLVSFNVFIGIIISILFITGCEESLENSGHRLPQGFIDLKYNEIAPPRLITDFADAINEPLDADSIEMFNYRGGTYYHPVYLINRCKHFIDAYVVTEQPHYLKKAEKYFRKLMTRAYPYKGADFLPYPFQFSVHGDTTLTFPPPWYSGMAQGTGLSVAMRLYEFTGTKEYMDYGHRLFKALCIPKSDTNPWVARIDSAGYYWIEEYPHNLKPGMTLNGFIGAILGVYEYYRLSSNPKAASVFEMSITTVKQYLPKYRQQNMKSLYCLGHKIPGKAYHFLHINQMKELYRITGDEYFMTMADILENDSDNEPKEDQ